MSNAIRFEKDSDNIVTLTIDMPGQSANTMNAQFRSALTATADKILAEKDSISGIIITSAKKTFFAGGDLKELITVKKEQATEFFNMVQQLKLQMRKIETMGKPVVAAINGTALGGGFEIALACHQRICLNDAKIQLGLPEVTLGLLPGGGGVARLCRLIGLEAAFPFLLEGKQVKPQEALNSGLIHALAENNADMLQQARAFIKANPSVQQPWDVKGYKIPGGTPSTPALAQKLAIAPSILRQKTKGCYPAPEKIMAAAAEGAQVDFDTACTIESRYFTELTTSQVAKNMIGTFFFQLNAIKAGGSRPQGVAPYTTKKVGILGAGMMGSGIAYACAMRGIEVVLKDVSKASADKGKTYSENLLAKRVAKKRMSAEKMADVLNLILATDNNADLQGCDLIIEAVFEDRDLKARVTTEAEPMLAAGGIFASNTSTLPITGLAEASTNAEKFIGLHFFSPVDKMPLVEIIKGRYTSDETLARAFDFVLQINKTPIVVNDSRGFFTSRVFATYVDEGVSLLAEGNNPILIENAAMQVGMPVGPLAVLDEVSLSLLIKISAQTRKDMQAEGKDLPISSAEKLGKQMVEEFGRAGKAAGAGFYEYPKGGKKFLWPELQTHYVKADKQLPLKDIQERLLFIQAIETLRCLEENVLMNVQDGNIGSIFGLGFAPWTGGALQYINQYGVRDFYQRAQQLTAQYGPRFSPPKTLVELAEKNTELK